MTHHASGTFEVKVNPLTDEAVGDPTVGRVSLDKKFLGDLEATSKSQMLTTDTEVKGSAGYVAIERVIDLSVTVVPDSGTGELVGLAGKMTINIIDGKHFYEFEYTLGESH